MCFTSTPARRCAFWLLSVGTLCVTSSILAVFTVDALGLDEAIFVSTCVLAVVGLILGLVLVVRSFAIAPVCCPTTVAERQVCRNGVYVLFRCLVGLSAALVIVGFASAMYFFWITSGQVAGIMSVVIGVVLTAGVVAGAVVYIGRLRNTPVVRDSPNDVCCCHCCCVPSTMQRIDDVRERLDALALSESDSDESVDVSVPTRYVGPVVPTRDPPPQVTYATDGDTVHGADSNVDIAHVHTGLTPRRFWHLTADANANEHSVIVVPDDDPDEDQEHPPVAARV